MLGLIFVIESLASLCVLTEGELVLGDAPTIIDIAVESVAGQKQLSMRRVWPEGDQIWNYRFLYTLWPEHTHRE
jgi:hypothetical protein